jgi:nitrogen-specific signal transduction histidine kinase
MMQNLSSPISRSVQSIAPPDNQDACALNGSIVDLEDLIHELRQPLSTIEALAYHLELTCSDSTKKGRLRLIREMIAKASVILDRARVPSGN